MGARRSKPARNCWQPGAAASRRRSSGSAGRLDREAEERLEQYGADTIGRERKKARLGGQCLAQPRQWDISIA
ncbi:MAG TPA: hypothetical protein DEP05_04460 [Betaproteobacteria bacterium]|nr:hypothetical protein [Betaproteobacteria bacterium]